MLNLKTSVENLNKKIAFFKKKNDSLLVAKEIYDQLEKLKNQAEYGTLFDYVFIAIISLVTIITILKQIYRLFCHKRSSQIESFPG